MIAKLLVLVALCAGGIGALKPIDIATFRERDQEGKKVNFLSLTFNPAKAMIPPLPVGTVVQLLEEETEAVLAEYLKREAKVLNGAYVASRSSSNQKAQVALLALLQNYAPMNAAEAGAAVYLASGGGSNAVKECLLPSADECTSTARSFVTRIIDRLKTINNIDVYGKSDTKKTGKYELKLVFPNRWRVHVNGLIQMLDGHIPGLKLSTEHESEWRAIKQRASSFATSVAPDA